MPHYLGPADHPWLRALLDEHERFTGRRQRDLDERLRGPLPCASPARKRKMAVAVLSALVGKRPRPGKTAVPPRRARAILFGEAARDPASAVERSATILGLSTDGLRASLFTDIPSERAVAPLPAELSPVELALRANLALAQALLFRSTNVRIAMEGNARAVIRLASLRGLISVVHERGEVELSGPLALFRRTLLYGRALGELVPLLAWCPRFRLEATCVLRDQSLRFRIRPGDPIFPSREPRRYDSLLEERFARDFARLTPDWDLVREPEPVPAGGVLLFPDFALQHRRDPTRRWLLEIIGFWTADYLARKLAHYRAANLTDLILCIDEERRCSAGDLPPNARIIPFHRRLDARTVLESIERAPH